MQDSILIDDMNLIGGGTYTYLAVINCEQRGIYTVKYVLRNVDNNIVQKENVYGGIVKYGTLDGGDYAENGLKMWCTSDKDKCVIGDSVTITTHLLNLQNDPFTGKIMIGIHDQGGVYFDVIDSLYFNDLKSDSLIEHQYKFAPLFSTSVMAGLYYHNWYYYCTNFANSITGMIDRGIWIIEGAELELRTNVVNDTIYPMQDILLERRIINKSTIDINAQLITKIDELNINDTTLFLISGLDTIIDTFSYETNIVFERQKINIVSYLYNRISLNDIKSNNVIIKPIGFEVLCNAIIDESEINIYNYMKNTSAITIYNIINSIKLLEKNETIFDSTFYLDSLEENGIYEDSIYFSYNDLKFGDYTLISTYMLFNDTIIKEKKYLNEIFIKFNLEKNTYT
ncbi:hypothetical protein KAU15_03595, partial [candidate division WOR-3 bacterium]|nr:hypothetical protein [candidate division WOR-3 bacterium]